MRGTAMGTVPTPVVSPLKIPMLFSSESNNSNEKEMLGLTPLTLIER
jgi:hypothetical protein